MLYLYIKLDYIYNMKFKTTHCRSLLKQLSGVRTRQYCKDNHIYDLYLANVIGDYAFWSISNSFVWAYTPQGNDFWKEHHNNSYNKGYLFRSTSSLINLLPKNNNFIYEV